MNLENDKDRITRANQFAASVTATPQETLGVDVRIDEEICACTGMTADNSSQSLIFQPALENAMLRDESGGSLVGFAIIAPLLFVILFGIIEFGILLFDKAMLTNAVREGARAGIVYNYDDNDTLPPEINDDTYHDTTNVESIVRGYCEETLISFGDGANLNVTVDPLGVLPLGNARTPLTVSATYRFQFLVFSNILALIGGDLADSLVLEAETVMRLE
jgi:hypothetical protein